MIGISVYLAKDKEEFNKKWIEKAAKNGFSSIFTSLHIPEDDPTAYKELLVNLGANAKENNMHLFADISPDSFRHLDLNTRDVKQLLAWGVTGLRVDYGFGAEAIVNLSKQIKVSLNASTLTKSFLQELIDLGLNTQNTEAAHNFYPRPETGLDRDYLIQKNKLLKSFKIGTSAFVPGDGEKRQPLFQGLPTLENHRHESPVNAYCDLAENCAVDSVYIGDPSLNEETLASFSLLGEGIIPIRYQGERVSEFTDFFSYLNGINSNRPDPARDVIRVEGSRVEFHRSNLCSRNTIKRSKGAITIDNEKYGRYAGEIHIALKELQEDPKVNVIGHVIEEDLQLLDYIGGGGKFYLKKVNE